MEKQIDQLTVDAIRTLSIDMINKANSGHPGLPMGAAPMAYTLWSRVMVHHPKDPNWFNRDRFVLSAGHGSALLYSLLHLFGYGLTIDDLKQFRQFGSKTPGHPEYGHTPGVEATTGPLGQGFAMAAGMAMAEAHLAEKYNRPAYPVVDHYTYVLSGDGDLMEGVTAESASLAGHLKLGKLIVLYDSNRISLDGGTDMAFTEDVQKRFQSYGWQTLTVEDGNNLNAVEQALNQAKADIHHPSLIEVRTVIGYGAPDVAGTHQVHGSPLGDQETALAKKGYGWTFDPFVVPEDVYRHCAESIQKGAAAEEKWKGLLAEYTKVYPDEGRELLSVIHGGLPENYDAELPDYQAGTEGATRKISGEVMQALNKSMPDLFGGAADLFSSVKTYLKDSGDFQPGHYAGKNIWFGVREFAMAGMVNGMTLHGGVKAYGSTFFTFSDYLKPALRLAALMKVPSIFVFTHDSIAVGEDGPTHEPVEQLAGLRAIPNLNVIRPADAVETREAWKQAVQSRDEPTVLVLTRQSTKTYQGEVEQAPEGVKRGGYVVSPADTTKEEDGILIATGSEVGLAIEAQQLLLREHVNVRVVSLPSFAQFDAQSKAYKDQILPPKLKKRIGIEMASSFGWDRYVGSEGTYLTIDRFGASGKGKDVTAAYGFTPEHVARLFIEYLTR
ncbi:transketolase [Sporolactobacillus sp. THM19-2]|uniref:transketolase n=1 Tax=Sporolactobacillus sp. THM19-2 TaxID=2511171 RepID=UPI00101FCC1F|nr:transketolase [Sporolactobacillus sp. THM19-2]RYL88156.1 transketolase [Sporolactobacillus sp. THM19-2]